MASKGWSDTSCRGRVDEAFRNKFWSATGVEDLNKQIETKSSAELAAKLGVTLDHAFNRNLDGTIPAQISSRPARYREAWLKPPNWSS
ncbi:hypothetical protein DL767_000040 [Monosporascus sp. MG133]|nr:hypothetical protein DL767_000040 [Monosporascus sp. MG133]